MIECVRARACAWYALWIRVMQASTHSGQLAHQYTHSSMRVFGNYLLLYWLFWQLESWGLSHRKLTKEAPSS